MSRTKTFPLGLVGESRCQSAIASLYRGDAVQLLHEADNPADPRAIVVRSPSGEKLGYVPRDSWLTRALLDEGKPVFASVLSIAGDGRRKGVVIEVTIGDGAVDAAEAHAQSNAIAKFIVWGGAVLLGVIVFGWLFG